MCSLCQGKPLILMSHAASVLNSCELSLGSVLMLLAS